MSPQLETGLRILFVYYMLALPLAGVYGVMTAKVRQGRSGFISLWRVLVLYLLVPGWFMTWGALVNNCGGGGGCESIPDWDLALSALVTALPVIGLARFASGLQRRRRGSDI